MSASINSSKSESSNYTNTNDLHNNYSAKEHDDLLDYDPPKIRIIITNHLCNPCPRYYTDIFGKVLIECKHPSHRQTIKEKINIVKANHRMRSSIGTLPAVDDLGVLNRPSDQ